MEKIIEALRSGQQCDEEGVMCIVSRQACHEAADKLSEFREAWHEIFAAFHDGGEINGDGFIDLTSEQIERLIALTS